MGVKGPLLGGARGLNKSAPPGVRTDPLGVKTGVIGAPTDPGAGETRLGCAFLLLLGWLFISVVLLVPFFRLKKEIKFDLGFFDDNLKMAFTKS